VAVDHCKSKEITLFEHRDVTLEKEDWENGAKTFLAYLSDHEV